MVVCLKVSNDGGPLLPSPLGYEERFPFMIETAISFLSCCADVIRHVVTSDIDLGHLPAFHLTLSFLPFKTLLMAKKSQPHKKAVSSRRSLRLIGTCSSHRIRRRATLLGG
jgi:hypothetical protein